MTPSMLRPQGFCQFLGQKRWRLQPLKHHNLFLPLALCHNETFFEEINQIIFFFFCLALPIKHASCKKTKVKVIEGSHSQGRPHNSDSIAVVVRVDATWHDKLARNKVLDCCPYGFLIYNLRGVRGAEIPTL